VSYTLEEITTIDPDVFNRLFDASYDAMVAGTYTSWDVLGENLDTQAKRRDALRARFEHIVSFGASHYHAILTKKDGYPIEMWIGYSWRPDFDNPDDPRYITYDYNVLGPDTNGSRSYLFDLDRRLAVKEFFLNTLNVVGYKMICIKDGSLYNYHRNGKPSELYTITEEDIDDSAVTVKFTYI
jgi:hypothetical protein